MSQSNATNPNAGANTGVELEPGRTSVNPWTIWAIIILIVLGMVVGYNYAIHKVRADHEKIVKGDGRPPIIGRLETDLEAVERSGKTVRLSQLKGKIMVFSYVYTRCPRQCGSVVGINKMLQEKFGNDPRFQIVSFSLDAGYDTPETLTAFAKMHQASGDNWWFLTGEPKETEDEKLAEQKRIRQYLTQSVGFHPVRMVPEKERLNDDDLYIHDARIAVIDHRAQVRGLHEVLHPQLSDVIYDKLVSDLEKLFKEADADAAAAAGEDGN